MGVELELLFCWEYREKADIFATIDTHKMLSTCYDDLFILPEGKVPKEFTTGRKISDPYGDEIKLYEPRAILGVIRKNMDELAKRDKNGFCDYEDERVQMAIGMLERLSLMNSKVKVGLSWF